MAKKIKKNEGTVEETSSNIIEETSSNTIEETVKSTTKIVIETPLPREIRVWKEYLIKLKTTPEEFLKRYPNHPLKEIILKIKQ